MKRLVSLFLISAFMLLAFAGCGNTDSEKSDNDTTITTVTKSTVPATVKTAKSVYSSSVKEIDFTLTNNSDDDTSKWIS